MIQDLKLQKSVEIIIQEIAVLYEKIRIEKFYKKVFTVFTYKNIFVLKSCFVYSGFIICLI